MAMTREDIMANALKEIRERRFRADRDLARRLEIIYADHPKLGELDATIRVEYFRGWARVLNKDSAISPELEIAKAQKRQYMQDHDIPIDYEVKLNTCKQCHDEGVDAEGKYCSCLLDLITALTPTGWEDSKPPEITFYDCRLDVISDSYKEQARKIYKSAMRYAKRFDQLDERNLFITGPQGTGKTHLVAAITNQAISRGFRALYVSANSLLAAIAESVMLNKAFKPDPDRLMLANYRMRHLRTVDLLVIDDLGVESENRHYGDFVDMLDIRHDRNRSTIITSNLSLTDIAKHYDARLASRVGGYQQIRMAGD